MTGRHRLDRYLDADAPVLGVIRLLLVQMIPIELANSLDDLARQVASHPEVAIHSTRVWGDLSEPQRTAVEREVRIVARSVGGT